MKREYHRWFSPVLGRDMELLLFGHAGRRLLVFPSRKQRFFEFEEKGMIGVLREKIEAGSLQVICIDGIDADSLYCFEKTPAQRIERHLQFERYVIDEVLPFCKVPGRKRTPITVHGCSFGAYHAVTIALRNPRYFERAVGFSGRYDLTLHTGDFHSLFHGFYNESLYYLMPSHFMPNLKEPKVLRAIRKVCFTLAIGREDPFYNDNVVLCRAFVEKKIPHEFQTWQGNCHRFRDWRQMARIYLP
ncbi:MAG: esterase [Chthoniobacteraceae bacterium]|nr:esterase [Chthoniobacteraceae bacterium]